MQARNLMSLNEEKQAVELLLNLDKLLTSNLEHTRLASFQLDAFLKTNPELINMGMPSFEGQPPLAFYINMKKSGVSLMLTDRYFNIITNATLNYTHDGRSFIAPMTRDKLFLERIKKDKSLISRIDKFAFNYSGSNLVPASIILLINHPTCMNEPDILKLFDVQTLIEKITIDALASLMETESGLALLMTLPPLLSAFNNLLNDVYDEVKKSNIEMKLGYKEFSSLRQAIKNAGLSKKNHSSHKTPAIEYKANNLPAKESKMLDQHDEAMLLMLLNNMNTESTNIEDCWMTQDILNKYLLSRPELLNMRLASYTDHPPFAYLLAYMRGGRNMMLNSPLFESISKATLNYTSCNDGSLLMHISHSEIARPLFTQSNFTADIDFNAFNSGQPSAAFTLVTNDPALFDNQSLVAKVDIDKLVNALKSGNIKQFSKILDSKFGRNLIMVHDELLDRLNKLLSETSINDRSQTSIRSLLKQDNCNCISRRLAERKNFTMVAAPATSTRSETDGSFFSNISLLFNKDDAANKAQGYALYSDTPNASKNNKGGKLA